MNRLKYLWQGWPQFRKSNGATSRATMQAWRTWRLSCALIQSVWLWALWSMTELCCVTLTDEWEKRKRPALFVWERSVLRLRRMRRMRDKGWGMRDDAICHPAHLGVCRWLWPNHRPQAAKVLVKLMMGGVIWHSTWPSFVFLRHR